MNSAFHCSEREQKMSLFEDAPQIKCQKTVSLFRAAKNCFIICYGKQSLGSCRNRSCWFSHQVERWLECASPAFAKQCAPLSWIINYTVLWVARSFFLSLSLFTGDAYTCRASSVFDDSAFVVSQNWALFRVSLKCDNKFESTNNGRRCPIEKRHMYKLHCCGNECAFWSNCANLSIDPTCFN